MGKNLYDVYDLENSLIISAMTSAEIAKALDVTVKHVSKCEIECKKLKRRYRVVKSDQEFKAMNTVEEMLLAKWDAVRKPFLNVEWVRESGPGVRVLSR